MGAGADERRRSRGATYPQSSRTVLVTCSVPRSIAASAAPVSRAEISPIVPSDRPRIFRARVRSARRALEGERNLKAREQPQILVRQRPTPQQRGLEAIGQLGVGLNRLNASCVPAATIGIFSSLPKYLMTLRKCRCLSTAPVLHK